MKAGATGTAVGLLWCATGRLRNRSGLTVQCDNGASTAARWRIKRRDAAEKEAASRRATSTSA